MGFLARVDPWEIWRIFQFVEKFLTVGGVEPSVFPLLVVVGMMKLFINLKLFYLDYSMKYLNVLSAVLHLIE